MYILRKEIGLRWFRKIRSFATIFYLTQPSRHIILELYSKDNEVGKYIFAKDTSELRGLGNDFVKLASLA